MNYSNLRVTYLLHLLLKKCQRMHRIVVTMIFFIFDEYFAMDDMNENVGLTNEFKPYSMLIDGF